MAALLDVHLEQIAQVIEGRAALSEESLLLDRGRLGIALGHNQPAQTRPVRAWNLLPDRLALMGAEADPAIFFRPGEEDAPAVVRHLDISEIRPALRIDAGRGAQENLHRLRVVGPQRAPPVEEPWTPGLERPLQAWIGREIDIVRNFLGIVDGHGD